MRHFFYFFISFIVAIFFVLLGIISVMLPWSPQIRTDLVQFILEDSFMIFIFGFGLILVGLGIVTNIIFSARRHHYEIRSGSNSTFIDESLFQDYLNTYWKQLFPKCEIPNRVFLKRNKIHVVADLPYATLPQQKILLKRIESDLSDVFSRILGYRNEYIISITFQNEPEPSTITKSNA